MNAETGFVAGFAGVRVQPPRGRRWPATLPGLLAAAADAAALALALAAGAGPAGIAVVALTVWIAAATGACGGEAALNPRAALPALLTGFLGALLLVAGLLTAVGLAAPSPAFALAGGAGLAAGRLALLPLARRIAGPGLRRVALCGEPVACARLQARLDALPPGLVAVTHLSHPARRGDGASALSAAAEAVRTGTADMIALAAGPFGPVATGGFPEASRDLGATVLIDRSAFPAALPAAPGGLGRAGLVVLLPGPRGASAAVAKRAADLALGGLLLALLAPVMAVIALAIRLDSPGPALFRQLRLGRNDRVFAILKFRTMTAPACRAPGPVIQAMPGDPRITRIGRFLRRTSLDELPQLFNVLGGSMSLVGPRPHALCQDAECRRRIRGYAARHLVRPGITGWAQVNGLRGPTVEPGLMERRLRHDLDYIKRWSLPLDLRILALTIPAVLRGTRAC